MLQPNGAKNFALAIRVRADRCLADAPAEPSSLRLRAQVHRIQRIRESMLLVWHPRNARKSFDRPVTRESAATRICIANDSGEKPFFSTFSSGSRQCALRCRCSSACEAHNGVTKIEAAISNAVTTQVMSSLRTAFEAGNRRTRAQHRAVICAEQVKLGAAAPSA